MPGWAPLYGLLVSILLPAPAGGMKTMGRYTARGLVKLALFAFTAPGILFGVVFAKIQCFGIRTPVARTPSQLGLAYENLQMTGADGVFTRGWYLPPPKAPAPAVILVHGHMGRRDQFLDEASWLQRAGFGVVLFDLRSHGESGDGVITFGLREAEEVRPYLDLIAAKPAHAGQRVGIIGWSMGAVTALRATSLYPRIAAVVADSPFASLTEQSRWRVSQFVGPTLTPYFWTFVLAAGTLMTRELPSAWEVTQWLPAIAPRPMFLIHGLEDLNIPPAATTRLAAAATGPVDAWHAPGANHINTRFAFPQEYRDRVVGFFRKHL
jgi:pimeloyl-ACP methyl ester carboxylesterase